MVFSGETTETDSTTTTSTGEVSAVEMAERVSTLMAPFLNLLTVLVQALTAYTLLKKL